MWFNDWLEQYVHTVHGSLKRKRCIARFTKSLWKFIIVNGYSWKITENHLKNCIATGLCCFQSSISMINYWCENNPGGLVKLTVIS